MSGRADAGLRRRHMACMAPGKSSDCACIGCMHQPVHYEMTNCREHCERIDDAGMSRHRCEPVSEANHG
jgi:hypothetical protein